MRGNCTRPFSRELAEAYGVEPDIDGVVAMPARALMAGHDCMPSAAFTSCPNAYIDPLSPAFVGAPWLTEAHESAEALGLGLSLSEFAPGATSPFRKLVQHVVSERARRSTV